jgi:hypothetical protein
LLPVIEAVRRMDRQQEQQIGKMSMHGLMSDRLLKRFLRGIRNKPKSAVNKAEAEAGIQEKDEKNDEPPAQSLDAGRKDTSDRAAPPDASQKTQ